jgi:hypothetical protein
MYFSLIALLPPLLTDISQRIYMWDSAHGVAMSAVAPTGLGDIEVD